MSEVARASQALERLLDAEGYLPAGRVLTHAVLVYRTFELTEDGTALFRLGRAYPLGELDPAMERGMLDEALFDARGGRRLNT